MEPITVKLKERSSVQRTGEPVRLGAHSPANEIFDQSGLEWQGTAGNSVPDQLSSFAFCPVKSVRWVCIEPKLCSQAINHSEAAISSQTGIGQVTHEAMIMYLAIARFLSNTHEYQEEATLTGGIIGRLLRDLTRFWRAAGKASPAQRLDQS